MSGCRHGGRDVYRHPDAREYDQSRPIRGRVVWDDGTESRITYGRYVNGVERRAAYVEMDGTRYEPISGTQGGGTGNRAERGHRRAVRDV